MSESNIENTIEIGCTKPAESPKHTLLTSSIIYAEYYNELQLYPNNILEKWKRELEIIRSRKDIKLSKNQSPVITSVNDEPKHETLKNTKNKDSFSVLPCEKDVSEKTSAEDQQTKSRENSVKKSHTDLKNVQKSNKSDKKPLIVKKPKQTHQQITVKNKTEIRKLNNNKHLVI